MKLILREYLASLREREELDAILPDLLSELGYTVYSRPGRGTTQNGVDVAALSPSVNDERKVYLFVIKKGDLTRQDWDGTPQGVRSSLNEILDVYIRNRIPARYTKLHVIICLCMGGDMQEQVRDNFEGYVKDHSNERVSFEEWNGDKLASLLLEGILREEILPRPLRSDFQKAVALLDEPEVAYRHFAKLVVRLREAAGTSAKQRVRAGRQIYICLWVLYVWSRDTGNLEAPYRASELAVLNAWELLRPLIGNPGKEHRALVRVFNQLIQVHLIIASELIDKKIAPAVMARDALAMAVASRTAVDVSLKLFDMLGRVAMTGLLLTWIVGRQDKDVVERIREQVTRLLDVGMSMIESNGALHLPLCDDQVTDITLFLLLCLWGGEIDGHRVLRWLETMADRHDFCVRFNGRYPTCFTEYTDLIEHPRDRAQGYFEEATAGSTLVPLLAMWTRALGRPDLATRMARMSEDKLEHCTMQLWTPDADSEVHLYVNSGIHGSSVTDLPIREEGRDLLERVAEACKSVGGHAELSAIQTGHWPVVLMACRHWRLPVPPDIYVSALQSIEAERC
ncbi:hypothetical protein [Filomicrobium sp.]|uniref:hypothetical protein n=1 Tax=Filomicrobium sp. TaxID=2024831 RepID=UPI00258C49B7|nr:hypothetical protein [Filomicrobium sp.]MCV0368723.1 hypothetical protein [Filomicrobium sp.]